MSNAKKTPLTDCVLNLIDFETKYYELLGQLINAAQSEGELLTALNTKEFEYLTSLRTNNLTALVNKKFDKFIMH